MQTTPDNRRSGPWQLVPAVAITTVFVLLAAAIGITIYYEQSFKFHSIQEAGVQTRVLASTMTAALVFNDRDTAQEYVDALQADPAILAVGIYNGSGRLSASHLKQGATVPESAPADGVFTSGDIVTIVAPVMQTTSRIGTVYFSTQTEPLGTRIARYGVIGLVFLMAALVVTILGFAHSALRNANRHLTELNEHLLAQIAGREKAEEALRQSQKMEALGQLSGGIAHDFNNFLTIIKNSLSLMERRLNAGNTDVGKYIVMANEGVNRAAGVTQRILSFSRRQSLSPKPVDLKNLVAELHPLLRNSMGASIAIQTRLRENCWVFCDENQMENAILNLLVNARDAMPEGGTVTIAAEPHRLVAAFGNLPPGDYVKLIIADTGTGMTEEVRRRALDPFFTTKPEGQGTGLGLSMIYGFVTQSGGEVTIESRVGFGTTVVILLPLLQDVPARKADKGAAGGAPGDLNAKDKAPTILVVEDEELVRSVVVESLRDHGFTVLEEGDGDAAAKILAGGAPIDLMISDIKLPGMNGIALAQQAMAKRPDMNVILVTGYHQEPIPEILIEKGLKVFHKPYNLTELLANAAEMAKPRRS
jgi:signal transduction histidine kinase